MKRSKKIVSLMAVCAAISGVTVDAGAEDWNGKANTEAVTVDSLTLTGTNSNTANVTVTNQMTNNGALTNNGTMSAKTLQNTSAINKEVANTSSKLTISDGGSSSGTIEQATIELTGGSFDNSAAMTATTELKNASALTNTSNITAQKLTNTNTIEGTGSLFVKNGGSSNKAVTQNTIDLQGGAFTNSAEMTANTEFKNASALTNTSTITAQKLTNTNTIGGTGSLFVKDGGSSNKAVTQNTIDLQGGAFTNSAEMTANTEFKNASALTNTSTITAQKLTNTNTINGTGSLIVLGGGTSDSEISQTVVSLTGDFLNSSSITANNFSNSGNLTGGTGSLVVNETGSSSGNINQHSVSLSGQFTNNGTITANTFVNKGVMTGDTGNLTITGGGSSENAITQSVINITSSFKNTADMTATSQLNFDVATADETLQNSANIVAETLVNKGTITGVENAEGDITYGNLTVNNGGTSTGMITQSEITLVDNEFKNSNLLKATDKLVIGNGNEGNNAILSNSQVIEVNSLENKGTIQGLVNENGDIILGDLKILNGGISEGNITQEQIYLENENAIFYNHGTMDVKDLVNQSVIEGFGKLIIEDGLSENTIYQNDITINGAFETSDQIGGRNSVTNNGILDVSGPNSHLVAVNLVDSNGILTNNGTINITEGYGIEADKLSNNGTINLTGSKVKVTYQSGDIAGTINVKDNEDRSVISVAGTNANLVGTINIGSDVQPVGVNSILEFKSGTIKEDATLNIHKGNALVIDTGNEEGLKANVVVGSNDTFTGDLALLNGSLALKDLDLTTGVVSTASIFGADATNPYYEQLGGTLYLNNTNLTMESAERIIGGSLGIDSTSSFTSQANGFNVNSLLTSGSLNAMNNGIEDYTASNIVIGDLLVDDNRADFTVDFDARSNQSARYDTFGSDEGKISSVSADKAAQIHVSDWNIQGDILGYDAPIDKNISMNIFKGAIEAGHNVNFTTTDKEVFTPIGWYKLNSAAGGNYSFDLDRYNPTVFRGQVAKVAQNQNQLAINDMLFNHTMVDQGFKGNDVVANRYSSSSDLFAPYQYSLKDGGLWAKSYGNFERLNMNHGFDVGNNAYGTLIGADFGLVDIGKGWSYLQTLYVGYNGAHQHWKGNSAYQNGAQLGMLGTWYKKDLMLGLLTYGGVYGNSTKTLRGDDDAFNYYGGVATKAAYNWKVHSDFAIQPNLLFSYNYFGQENWHSDFGQMGMMSSALHGINLAPGLNLIWEKETFSTYLTVQYMYNLSQAAGGRAGNVNLPHVHMDRGYVQYGLGINKRFSDTFSGYGQVVARNVGRTGVGFQVGVNWKLGEEPAR